MSVSTSRYTSSEIIARKARFTELATSIEDILSIYKQGKEKDETKNSGMEFKGKDEKEKEKERGNEMQWRGSHKRENRGAVTIAAGWGTFADASPDNEERNQTHDSTSNRYGDGGTDKDRERERDREGEGEGEGERPLTAESLLITLSIPVPNTPLPPNPSSQARSYRPSNNTLKLKTAQQQQDSEEGEGEREGEVDLFDVASVGRSTRAKQSRAAKEKESGAIKLQQQQLEEVEQRRKESGERSESWNFTDDGSRVHSQSLTGSRAATSDTSQYDDDFEGEGEEGKEGEGEGEGSMFDSDPDDYSLMSATSALAHASVFINEDNDSAEDGTEWVGVGAKGGMVSSFVTGVGTTMAMRYPGQLGSLSGSSIEPIRASQVSVCAPY